MALEIGFGSYGTPIIKSYSSLVKVTIGKYCSIGDMVILSGGEHIASRITTYPFDVYRGDCLAHSKGEVHIGNDVWIGTQVLILSGVTIGDGAVIGAGSVVASDVQPYAIVAGNPARLIRYRFNPEIIKKLLALAWWNWSEEKVKASYAFLMSDPEKLTF